MPSHNEPTEPGSRLEGRVAVVTGGATGIGAAIVRLFANEGARVSFCSRSEQPGLDLERELKGKGRDVVFSRCDAAIEKEAKALVKSTLDRYGGIDLLVNNAAVSKLVPVEEMSLADWELVLTKNLTSMFLMSRESIPALRRSQHANIINLGSTYAVVGASGSAAYALTKAGAVSFSKTLALELARDGIRVNALCPGATETRLYHEWLGSQADAERAKSDLAAKHPLGRIGQPDEMARAALYLASDDASFVTGHALLVDGGYTAQ
jgi:meso-butanediol dehydrogenase / (S,S)-butanediol dehydrogenase / diacetyl reductase